MKKAIKTCMIIFTCIVLINISYFIYAYPNNEVVEYETAAELDESGGGNDYFPCGNWKKCFFDNIYRRCVTEDFSIGQLTSVCYCYCE